MPSLGGKISSDDICTFDRVLTKRTLRFLSHMFDIKHRAIRYPNLRFGEALHPITVRHSSSAKRRKTLFPSAGFAREMTKKHFTDTR